MKQRRLAALRALAERPGTPAEGAVAREMLAREEAKRIEQYPADQQEKWRLFAEYLRTGDLDIFQRAVSMPIYCPCGAEKRGGACTEPVRHGDIEREIRRRFPRGSRVYYNGWPYPKDCPGTVVGYATWNWIRLKFDHLKTVRRCPIYKNGWYLSTEPKGEPK